MIRLVLGLKQPLFYLWLSYAQLSSYGAPSAVVLEAMRGLAEPSGELIQPGLLTCVFRYETDEPKCTADAGLAGLNAF